MSQWATLRKPEPPDETRAAIPEALRTVVFTEEEWLKLANLVHSTDETVMDDVRMALEVLAAVIARSVVEVLKVEGHNQKGST